MNVDIVGHGNSFEVRNSETGEKIDVKHVTLSLNLDGLVEVMLYVGLGKLELAELSRHAPGVRDELPPCTSGDHNRVCRASQGKDCTLNA